MNKRQGDMKEKIQEVAIDLFTKQGYDKTSLREIAECLEVSKAALYYYFKSKEEILRSISEALVGAVNELIEWGESQPRSMESRKEFLHRIATFIVSDRLQSLLRFAQANSTVMGTVNAGRDTKEQNLSMVRRIKALVCDPDANLTDQLRAFFAVLVLFVSASPILPTLGLEASSEQISEAALDIALDLISQAQPSRPATT
jgi:AcrR family transcriptional regulator